MLECVEQQVNGFENWHVTRSAGSYMDLFAGRESELVYLTADSTNELTEVRQI
jgi:hypothetical protein